MDQPSPEQPSPEQPSPAPESPEQSDERSPMTRALSRAGQLMVLLERHLDRAVGMGATEGHEMEELGRAWVRASQLEQLLRGVLPPGATDSITVDDPDAGSAAPDAPRDA